MQLTPQEIEQMTGKSQPAAQLRHLRRMGIRAYRSDNPEFPVCVMREWLVARSDPKPNRPQVRSSREPSAQA